MVLQVIQVKGGYDSNFCNLVWDESTMDGAILDTSLPAKQMLELAKEKEVTIKFVLMMHSHFDHIIDLDIYREHGIQIIAHSSYTDIHKKSVEDGDELKIGNETIKIIHAPGHRFDCIMAHGDGKIFTTDVLFVQGCGRCDFAGSDVHAMYDTLYNKFLALPDDTIIYPGHDYGPTPTSTIGKEKQSNHYLTCKSEKEFIVERMGGAYPFDKV